MIISFWLQLLATGEMELGGLSCQQMLNQGDGSSATPLTDSLVSAIAASSHVRKDQVTIEYACDERRAMSLSISFSITLSASDLESTAVTAGGESQAEQLVSLLDTAVSSGSFATTVTEEASKRGEVVAVKATILESVCLTCDIEEVIVTNIQVSESVYVGTVVLLLLVAVLLFFGELAILIGLRSRITPDQTHEQSSRKTLDLCETRASNCDQESTGTGKVAKAEWVTHYGSDAGFDQYEADGDQQAIASGTRLLPFVCLVGVETLWWLQTI